MRPAGGGTKPGGESTCPRRMGQQGRNRGCSLECDGRPLAHGLRQGIDAINPLKPAPALSSNSLQLRPGPIRLTFRVRRRPTPSWGKRTDPRSQRYGARLLRPTFADLNAIDLSPWPRPGPNSTRTFDGPAFHHLGAWDALRPRSDVLRGANIGSGPGFCPHSRARIATAMRSAWSFT